MGAMNQVLGNIELTQPFPFHVDVMPQQVTVSKHCHGKFFANYPDLLTAWDRFLYYNSYSIESWNFPYHRVTMTDGSTHRFILLETKWDTEKLKELEFYTVDVDRDITDPSLLQFIHTRCRQWQF